MDDSRLLDLFRAVFRRAPVALVVAERDGRIVQTNEAFEALLRRSEQDLCGRTVAEITHPEDVPASVEALREMYGGRRDAFALEKRYLRSDGSLVFARTMVGAVRGPDGEVRYSFAAVTDVTELKQAEDALRRSEAQLRALLEAMPDMVFRVRRDGTVLGYHGGRGGGTALLPGVFVGRPIQQTMPEDVSRAFVGAAEQALATGEVQRFDYQVHVPLAGGPLRHREAQAAVSGEDEVVIVARDVTDRVALEQELGQAQKLEAVGRLAGGVAHDFNNLLTVMRGYAELALRALPAGAPGRGEVELIRKAAQRASALTDHLLAFSRQQIRTPEVLDVARVIADVDRLLRRLVRADVEMAVSSCPEPCPVLADRAQLEQVVFNLVVNAVEAMPAGGRLQIATARVDLDEGSARAHALAPGRYVVLSVSDSGVGMDAETRSRLFEPFFTTKGASRGVGLGLASVYGIVKQSGGHIHVDSEPGRGTTFRVCLPRVDGQPAALDSDDAHAPLRGGSETILLAEDEDMVRELAATVLRGAGYIVLCAADGPEAVAGCDRHGGDLHLVIADVVMPRMSGRELAEAVRARRPAARVLYVSGYTRNVIVHDGVVGSDVQLLQKPFTPDALLRKVREVLDAPVR